MRLISCMPDAPGGRAWLVLLHAANDDAGGFATCVESEHADHAAARRAQSSRRWGILRLPPAPPRRRAPDPGPAALGLSVLEA